MWNYKGQRIKSREDLPAEAIGFVYRILNRRTEQVYIGKKILLNKRTRPPLKGYKRKRIDYVESNWMKYTGSNKESKKWEIENCYREIIYICYNKTMMSYYETKLQFTENVLENDKFLNDNILGKFYKKDRMEMQFLEEKYSVDLNEVLEYPPVAISCGTYKENNFEGKLVEYEIPLGTDGNFAFTQAYPKVGKSFFISLLVSAYQGGSNKYTGKIKGNRKKRKIIHFNTEQGKFHVSKLAKRTMVMNNI